MRCRFICYSGQGNIPLAGLVDVGDLRHPGYLLYTVGDPIAPHRQRRGGQTEPQHPLNPVYREPPFLKCDAYVKQLYIANRHF